MLFVYLIDLFYIMFFFIWQNFNPNPYFEDTKITKSFTFLDEGTTKITATSIKWKEGKVKSQTMNFCLLAV